MGIGGTKCGDKCKHFVLIQQNRFAGCQIIGTNNHLAVSQVVCICIYIQILNQSIGDVFDIGCTCLHIGIIHGTKHLCKIIGRQCNGILCIDQLRFNDVFNGFIVILIFQHHHMNFKNLRIGLADFFQCLLINRLQLIGRTLFCCGNTCFFCFHIGDVSSLYSYFLPLKNGKLSNCNGSINAFS